MTVKNDCQLKKLRLVLKNASDAETVKERNELSENPVLDFVRK
jgi:hypothetical protein